ncbi:hypothetical protein PENSTE_c015G01253 [Penicillium steckii]|uniref:Mid2 domain-containing protein n=1 Tax=Penicillium steckii TaxID=303698 RepID=A0A1V6T0N4_9EURO|nr:hypothetical protein PENSTE_c015G01253 [Penicillium steckii]
MGWGNIVLVLALIQLAWADDIITATGTLPASQQGFAQSGSSWSAVTCDDPSQTFVMSSTYGRCCTNTHLNCGFATSCIDTATTTGATIFYGGDAGPSVCASGNTCVFMEIYDYATTETPIFDIWCASDWPSSASTIFRSTAPATTTTDSQTTTTATPGSSATSTTAAATTTASNANGGEKKESKAWIAGAVIGPVAGCAILGALGFWLARRMRNKNEANQPSQGQDKGYFQPGQSQGYSELASNTVPQELPAYPTGNGPKSRPSELPSTNTR